MLVPCRCFAVYIYAVDGSSSGFAERGLATALSVSLVIYDNFS